MKTIEHSIHEFEIQKSKFICCIKSVHNENEAKNFIESIKNKYPDATHYCYSYIIDNIKRFQDDGEPSGTAGMPILYVLESNNLQHIIAIVVRYFGGIKLGAGGLVRAYTNSVSECIYSSQIIELEKCQIIDIYFDYSNIKQIEYLLQNYTILKKEFGEKILFKIATEDKSINTLIDLLKPIIDSYVIKKQITYIKKSG